MPLPVVAPIAGAIVSVVPWYILGPVTVVLLWRQINAYTKALVFTAILAMIYDATFAEDRDMTLNDLAVVLVGGWAVHRVRR